MTKLEKQQIKENARIHLLELVKPGDTIYTNLRHVSGSGMSRNISLQIVKDGQITDITYMAARLMDDSIAKDGGIKVSGCGMDMGFSLVYNLGHYLWPEGTPQPHGTRNGVPDSDGGYALHHRWL